MAKQKRPTFTTPRGRAIYPRLDSPDTKFKAEGVYRTKLAIPTSLAEGLIEEIDKAHAAAQVEAKEKNPKEKKIKESTLPYETNPDNEDETVFNFKMSASFKDKKTDEIVNMKPGIFDAKGKPVSPRIGGGSILRVNFEMLPYFTKLAGAGVSLRMKGVQVLELKEWGGGDAASYGFETEEGYDSGGEESEESTEKPEDAPAGEEKDPSTGSDF